jgi:hypothetical protein
VSSNSANSKDVVYAAAQGREYLRGQLDGKDPQYVRVFAGLVDDAETLDLLNYLCSIWDPQAEVSEDDPEGATTSPDNFLDSKLADEILTSAHTRSVDDAYRSGNVSQLQGMVGLTKNAGDATDALAEIVRRLSQEGTIAVVTGPPGAGKTSATVDVARAWGAWTGGAMYGVTSWDGFDKVVSSDMEMLESMASHSRPTLGVLDETMQELTGRGADVEKAETFADRASLIRKKEREHGPHPKKGSLVLVSHVWGRMNKPTREMTTLVIQKPSRSDPGKVVLYESEGGEDTREKIGEFTGLTDSRETFPEHEASSFRIVTDEEADEDDGPSVEQVERREAIKTVVRACKPWHENDGLNYRDAAGLVSYSKSWVGDRVREWSDGQHRDLVAGPNGGNA